MGTSAWKITVLEKNQFFKKGYSVTEIKGTEVKKTNTHLKIPYMIPFTKRIYNLASLSRAGEKAHSKALAEVWIH